MDIRCNLQCQKVLPCRHTCIRRCCEPCGACITTINVKLPCGHTMEGECNFFRDMASGKKTGKCPVCKTVVVP